MTAHRPTDPALGAAAGTGGPSSSWGEVFRGPLAPLTLGLLTVEATTGLQYFAVVTVLPAVTGDLHGRSWYGAALAAATLSVLAAAPWAAPLSARLGRSRLLTGAVVANSAGALASALAPAMWVFIAGRALVGLATGLVTTIGLSAVASAYPARLRPRMLSLTAGVWFVPTLVGPPYAAFTAEALGWRWALLLLIPPLLAGRMLMVRGTRLLARLVSAPGGVHPGRRLPLGGSALVVAGTAVLIAGTGTPPLAAAGITVAGLLLAGTGAVRLLPAGTLRVVPGPPAAIAGMLVMCFAVYGGDGLMSLYVTAGLGGTLAQAGVALMIGSLGWSAASLLQPRLLLLGGLGVRVVGVIGGLLLTVPFVLLVAVLTVPATVFGQNGTGAWVTWLAWGIGGVGVGLAFPSFSLAAMESPAGPAGPAAGLSADAAASALVLAETFGGCLGSAIGGGLYSQGARLGLDSAAALRLPYAAFLAVALLVPAAAARAGRARRAG